MSMKKNILLASAACCLLWSGAQAAPNILLIIGDDLGVDALASYGVAEHTPATAALDELANALKAAVYGMRNHRYKLLRYEGEEEFYDLRDDPYENLDLLQDGLTEQQQSEYQVLKTRIRVLRDSR